MSALTFGDFAQSTTCHGVAHIESSKQTICKLGWSAMVLAMLGFYIYGAYQTVTAYVNAGPATSMQLQRVIGAPMPDVLICNKASLDLARMQAANFSLETVIFLLDFPYLTTLDIDEIGNNRFTIEFTNETLTKMDNEVGQFLKLHNFSDVFDLYEYFRIPPERFIRSIGNGMSGPVNMSTFYANAIMVHHYLYRICYVYSANASIGWPGMYDGITLYLEAPKNQSSQAYTLQNRYFASYEGGFALEIDLPLVTENNDFVQIPLNTIADVHIGMTNTTYSMLRQPWPLSTPLCNSTVNAFTPNQCFFYRFATVAMDLVGCVPYPYKLYLVGDNITTCFPADYAKFSLTAQFGAKMGTIPDCLPACNELSFTMSVTYGSFDTARFLQDRNQTAGTTDVSVVRMGYTHLVVTNIGYSQSITLDTVISDLGAQLGLFLGGSIITIVHAFDFLLRVAAYNARKKRKTANQSIYDTKDVSQYQCHPTTYL